MITIKQILNKAYSKYFIYSLNKRIRYNSSSGGFCKSILCYLIDIKKVDAVIITRTGSKENPLKPETIITNKKKDIISTRTNSIYAPTNPLIILKNTEKNKKYAFVGLPCHCKALKDMQKKGLYKNIKLIISLFCCHTPKMGFTQEILKNQKINKKEVEKIEYRGNGWPGSFTIYLKNGGKIHLESKKCWSISYKYFRNNCKKCNLLAIYSDISVCDPWNLGFEKNDNKGKTLVLCNNKKSNILVREAEKLKYLKILKCSSEQFKKSQSPHIEIKIKRSNLN
jgi:coenzyme F420 hydrogenase subunit beta